MSLKNHRSFYGVLDLLGTHSDDRIRGVDGVRLASWHVVVNVKWILLWHIANFPWWCFKYLRGYPPSKLG